MTQLLISSEHRITHTHILCRSVCEREIFSSSNCIACVADTSSVGTSETVTRVRTNEHRCVYTHTSLYIKEYVGKKKTDKSVRF